MIAIYAEFLLLHFFILCEKDLEIMIIQKWVNFMNFAD
jgi:hypothetical protein